MPHHPVEYLFEELEKIDYYPAGIVPVPGRLPHTSFFPGGYGLWDAWEGKELPPFPVGKIMVVGQDWGTLKTFNNDLEEPGKNLKVGMWGGLRRFFEKTEINLEDCFFTNFFMGLRETEPAMGEHPAIHDKIFRDECGKFFLTQLETQKPRLVFSLGKYVPKLLATLSDDLRDWRYCDKLLEIDDQGPLRRNVRFENGVTATVVSLVHPSNRHFNVGRRRYKNYEGEEAELALVKEGLKEIAG